MSHIVFTVLRDLTPLYYEISLELQKRGNSISFISASPRWTEWLRAKGVSSESILSLNCCATYDQDVAPRILDLEKVAGISVNNMILMDRLVRTWNSDRATEYLAGIYDQIRGFIAISNISCVIGEPTPSSDILTSVICESLGVRYLFPLTTRIPDDRFAFFLGRLCNRIAPNKCAQSSCSDADVWATSFIKKYREKEPKPYYFSLNNKKGIFNLKRCYRIFSELYLRMVSKSDGVDPTLPTIGWLLKRSICATINTLALKLISFYHPDGSDRYIVYPLHQQPESSVDVLGDFYSDQFNLIVQIVRSLPFGYKLYVKEHSNAIGARSVLFYRNVLRLPNTKLIDPMFDSFALMRGSAGVVTISGTMAYEAGMLGVPAITLAEMYFNKIDSVRHCSNILDLPSMIRDMVSRKGVDEVKLRDFISYLYRNSFEGIFTNARSRPDVLDERNIIAIADAIESVV